MTSLRQRMIEDLRLRNYAERTVETYVMRVAAFARHFGRPPDRLGPEEIRRYQLHLLERKASWAVFNQTVCALRFFYGVTLNRKRAVEQIPFPRQEKKLPVVLSREEVLLLLGTLENIKHRTILSAIYACGLRLSEALHLQVSDIDSRRMAVRIRRGKGGKDRYLPLPATLLRQLRCYWRHCRPPQWLFPGKQEGSPLTHSSVQRVCRRILEQIRVIDGQLREREKSHPHEGG